MSRAAMLSSNTVSRKADMTGCRPSPRTTQTIPIVFVAGVDPVQTGLVASIARPGGNLTGISQLINEVVAKRIELLHEVAPDAAKIAMLTNPANPLPAAAERQEAQSAA